MQRAYMAARYFAVVLLLVFAIRNALAYKPATIAQLEQILSAAHGKTDKDLARQLGELELTERLSTFRLETLEASVPGDKSRQALRVLSDMSALHDLPAAEIPPIAVPDGDTQNKILSKTADYVRTLHQLIDMVVSRETSYFDNLKVIRLRGSSTGLDAILFPPAGLAVVENQPYRLAGKRSETITYRNGEEAVVLRDGRAVVAAPENAPKRPPPLGISNWGVFGPLAEILVNDISAGKADWSHWEQAGKSTVAVFRYSVPPDLSNYNLEFCCFASRDEPTGVVGPENWNVYETLPSYHGEIAINPETGAILRLTIQTDIPDHQPIYSADIEVEYGPVELGGKEYLLPTRSVTISQAPVHIMIQEGSCGRDSGCAPRLYVHPKDTVVSDTMYGTYHVFRAEMRILPTGASDPVRDSPSSAHPQIGTPREW